jgi:hypothetical protein
LSSCCPLICRASPHLCPASLPVHGVGENCFQVSRLPVSFMPKSELDSCHSKLTFNFYGQLIIVQFFRWQYVVVYSYATCWLSQNIGEDTSSHTPIFSFVMRIFEILYSSYFVLYNTSPNFPSNLIPAVPVLPCGRSQLLGLRKNPDA